MEPDMDNTLFQELFSRLGRMEEKLDMVVRVEERQQRQERSVEEIKRRLDAHDNDIGHLQSQVANMSTTSTHRWGVFAKVFFGVLAFVGIVGAPVFAELLLLKMGIK